MLLGRAALLVAFLPHAPHTREFVLPRAAVVHIEGVYHLSTETAQYKDMCDTYRLSSVKVRRIFSTYHRVTSGEMHDSYLFNGCGIKGTVVIGAKTFEWKAEPLNTMETNYPDGKWKLLGGEYSSDPSMGE